MKIYLVSFNDEFPFGVSISETNAKAKGMEKAKAEAQKEFDKEKRANKRFIKRTRWKIEVLKNYLYDTPLPKGCFYYKGTYREKIELDCYFSDRTFTQIFIKNKEDAEMMIEDYKNIIETKTQTPDFNLDAKTRKIFKKCIKITEMEVNE